MKKRILVFLMCLLAFCLPVLAKDAPNPGNMKQIVQYPVVACAITVPGDWVCDIDESNVLMAQKPDGSIVVFIDAKRQNTRFADLGQLTEQGKKSFVRQMQTEAAEGRKNFKIDKEGFVEQNKRTIYDMQFTYYDEDLKQDSYCHTFWFVKDNKLVRITGLCSIAVTEMSDLDNILAGAGF